MLYFFYLIFVLQISINFFFSFLIPIIHLFVFSYDSEIDFVSHRLDYLKEFSWLKSRLSHMILYSIILAWEYAALVVAYRKIRSFRLSLLIFYLKIIQPRVFILLFHKTNYKRTVATNFSRYFVIIHECSLITRSRFVTEKYVWIIHLSST